MRRQRFKDIWANQTELGKTYGLAAIAVGAILKAAGLKDPSTGAATPRALAEGFAVSTPLKDGTPFFLWHIEKVGALISVRHTPLSVVETHVREVLNDLKEIDEAWDAGDDKVACLMLNILGDDVPADVRAEVMAEVERRRPDRASGDPPAAPKNLVDMTIRAPWEDECL